MKKHILYWDDNIRYRALCRYTVDLLKAKENHFIVVLENLYDNGQRDNKGNLIKPTITTKLREQGFVPRLIYKDDSNTNFIDYDPTPTVRILHIRTEEKFNYFKLLFPETIRFYSKVCDL